MLPLVTPAPNATTPGAVVVMPKSETVAVPPPALFTTLTSLRVGAMSSLVIVQVALSPSASSMVPAWASKSMPSLPSQDQALGE